ncbi:hypothetical protein FBU30_001038 [Linnemannia zychae]|nr:hypothetical protein FBU30_001038 [Linnemannia zychae]
MAVERKVAIVTGANSGVGYSVVERLAKESPVPLTIILACRNKARAEEAVSSLKKHFDAHQKACSSPSSSSSTQPTHNIAGQPLQIFQYPELKIELVDVGSAASVLAFNQRILEQYKQVDFLFCNAGILPSSGIMWGKLLMDMIVAPKDLVVRADVLVQPKQHLNEDGIGNVLACNVFGHYLMIKGLEDVLNKTEEDPGRIIWTSSLTAEKACFRIDDWQGLEAEQPYESSKWVTDLLAIRLNEEWGVDGSEKSSGDAMKVCETSDSSFKLGLESGPTRRVTRSASKNSMVTNQTPPTRSKKHIISLSTQPGVVASGIGGLAAWIVMLRLALHYAVRLFGESSQTITGYHGAHSNVYAALKQPIEKVDFRSKYGSCVKAFGKEFLRVEKMVEYDQTQAEFVVGKLEALRQEVLTKKA